jgi:hypothetical protein
MHNDDLIERAERLTDLILSLADVMGVELPTPPPVRGRPQLSLVPCIRDD